MVPPPVLPPPKNGYADAFWCTYLVSVAAASVAEVGRTSRASHPAVVFWGNAWGVSSRTDACPARGRRERRPRRPPAVTRACSVTVTYPLDLTKTRLQIQGERAALVAAGPAGEASKGAYRGMLRTAAGIAREEGPLCLWRGVTPAIYRHVVYSGIRIVTYEQLRDGVFKREPGGAFPVKSAISGVTSGALAQFVASPTDLVKVHVQMEGRRRLLGQPPRVRGAWHAFRKIVAEGGVRGLWKGSIPNVQRAALVNLGDLTTYDSAKRFILTHTALPDSHLTHMLSSACAGLVAATMGTPADVVKTRIMNQPTDASGRYPDSKSTKKFGPDHFFEPTEVTPTIALGVTGSWAVQYAATSCATDACASLVNDPCTAVPHKAILEDESVTSVCDPIPEMAPNQVLLTLMQPSS
ncbi:Mitochondrial uncoupling protein 4C [Gryllus bimaculatus]|nr:Mitochondrial uncoupling protein 4C [Gryllus bimaculatus]